MNGSLSPWDKLRWAVAVLIMVLFAVSLTGHLINHTATLDTLTIAVITALFGPELLGRKK
jgi:hypothetical protein